jgi:hypothetical protein
MEETYMKKTLLLFSLLGLWASLAAAQNAPSGDQSQAQNSNTNSVQGCLSMTGGNYMLTQDGNSATYKLMGKESQLKKHVGHEVAITGSMTPGAGQDQGQGDTSPSASTPTSIQVTDVKMVAKSCSTGNTPPSQ